MQGTVVVVSVKPGDQVNAGRQLVVLESMKMEHVVAAPVSGRVAGVTVSAGETVKRNQPASCRSSRARRSSTNPRPWRLSVPGSGRTWPKYSIAGPPARREPAGSGGPPARPGAAHCSGEHRATCVIRGVLSSTGRWRSRLSGSGVRLRISWRRTPADGLVCGIGDVNGIACVVMSYDYTVLAGTQGYQNHRKTDRMLELAERRRIPLVLFAEGGGGRPGDTDIPMSRRST